MNEMNIHEMRMRLGDTQSAFAKRYNIPFRTIQNWEAGIRKPPEYLRELLEKQVKADLVNRRTFTIPKYDPHKLTLPKRSTFIGAFSWLEAIKERVNEDLVFALDEALMCDGSFGGRNEEDVVWAYGSIKLLRFNGIVLLGEKINHHDVKETDGILYTDFNRTLNDALANEHILDMQGITEALSRYYFQNNESFEGLSVSPQYTELFEDLMDAALHYYES